MKSYALTIADRIAHQARDEFALALKNKLRGCSDVDHILVDSVIDDVLVELEENDDELL